jgi:hypothetical protein
MLRTSLVVLFVCLCAPGRELWAGDDSPSVVAAADEIDRILQRSWDRDGITAAAISSDAEFCRRVWLDLSGVAPPVSEVRRFLNDPGANKRSQLIDRLLRSPQHASHMASHWIDILLPADIQVQPQSRENIAGLHEWLQQQFMKNTPYDYFVGGFLTAGGAGNSGPAIFYTSHALEPKKLASATSRIFMGIQLQCAECHDHPTDRWTQDDFWQYAAFFGQLQQTDGRTGNDTIIEDRPGGEVTLPDSDRVMSPRYPGIQQSPEKDPTDNRRRQLTIWMASRDNPYFARAAVNRVWAHLFGRGLVDPVDAMDLDNRPSHPELLDHLAEFLVQQRFDLRSVYAAVARSSAYSRTSSVPGDRPPPDSFAAMNVKTLTPRQFYDSLQQNVFRRSAVSAGNMVPGDQAASGAAQREQFLQRMRATDASPRDYPHGVVQALGLMNGPEITMATRENQSALLGAVEAPFFDEPQRIETLFLAALSREPTQSERERVGVLLKQAKSSQQRLATLGDLLWVLLNTAECAVCP